MSVLARLGVLLVAMGALLALPSRPTLAAMTNIQVGNNWFCNAGFANGSCPTTIAVGDTVNWNFPTGIVPHSTTECGASCDAPTVTPLWDSGLQTSGSFPRVFTQAGVFLYRCTVHDSSLSKMRGQITVVAASVGGIAQLPAAANAPLNGATSSSSSVGLIAGSAAIAAGLVALAGGAWYARRRRVS